MARLIRRRPARRVKRRTVRKARRVSRRKGGKKKSLSPMSQYAKIVETIEFTELDADSPYQNTFFLAQFYRATTLAKNFQFYKAAKVKWEYMPFYNTFQEGNSTGTVGKPQMYFIMNRDQDPYWSNRAPADALFSMQSSGVDPVPFTTNREIIYKPNWCSPGLSALTFATVADPQGQPVKAVSNVISLGLKKQFGWLATPDKDAYFAPGQYNPVEDFVAYAPGVTAAPTANAGVIYNGHNIYISQEGEPDTPVCKIVCTVEWHFKGPKNNYNEDQKLQVKPSLSHIPKAQSS